MKKYLLVLSALAISCTVAAKLPAPSEEVKAKAAEAAAKTAHGNKVAGYKLCLSQDRVAAHYFKTQGKGKPAPKGGSPCVDPGAFKPADTAAAPAAKPAVTPAKKG
ncbi:MAG: hypothetical protein RJB14_684 [Pseudomonadota bacterium]|jgi:hypothetical protein